jgi:transcriptional regulator with XRE-family HTH domain
MGAHFKEPVSNVSERLKQALELRHMTAAELSRLTNITTASLSHYINGRYIPKQDKIYQLSEALRVSPSWLMGLDVDIDGNEKSDLPSIVEETPALYSASTTPDEAYNKIIADMKDILSNQEARTRQIAVMIDEVEATLHNAARNSTMSDSLLAKYSRLSSVNKSIIDSTIDAMLKTQSSEKEVTNANNQEVV